MAEVTLYTPREMMAAMREWVRPDSFLKGRLVNAPDSISDTKYIEIDDEQITQDIAAYNSRTGEPVEVSKDGYATKIHVAPYVDDMQTISTADLDTRLPGETVYEGSAVSRKAELVNKALMRMSDRLDRLEESQIAEVIQKGTVTVLNATTGQNFTIDFGLPAANKATLSGANVWGGGSSDILGNFQTWCGQLQKRGYTVVDAYMHQDAANLLMADATIKGLLDNRAINIGEISPREIAGQRASYLGMIAYPGLNVMLWVYNGGYESAPGTFVKYFDQYRVVLVGSGFGIQPHYGKIENHKTNYKVKRFPNMWDDGGRGKKIYVGMESSPLMVAKNIRGIFSAIVVS